jgi:hypothetical protein
MKRHKGRQRKIRQRILILCEGITEKNYFQAIKEDSEYKQALSAIHPKVVAAKNPTPENIVKEAIDRSEKEAQLGNPYDSVWVVFDHDNHTHREKAYAKAKSSSFNIAFSAIAFEYWYLIHFVKTAKAFTNANALKTALKEHYPTYEKAKQNDFAILKPNLSQAIENADWLRNQVSDEEKAITDHNPWTDVDVLVSKMIDGNI